MRTPIRLTLAATALTSLGLGASVSHAGGFALIEQGVKGLGNAYAGAAASAEDASTVFFNPAGMTQLSGSQVIAGVHAIKPSTKFSDDGSKSTITNLNTTGGNGGDAADLALIPNLFLVADVSDEVKVGLGISVPFGLGTNYDKDWKGRYQAVETAVEVININPSLAFKVNPQWSVGLGANIQYFKAKLSNAVDFSSICLGTLSPASCAGLGLASPQNPTTDGFADITGSSWGVGYNLGVLFAPSEVTRIGLAYRSQVKHSLDGTADFTLPASAPAAAQSVFGPVFADTSITGNIDLPSMLSLSAFHQLNDAWALLADVTRTGWSSYDKLVIEFENPAKDPSEEVNDWKNVNRYSLGINFTPNPTWTYRAGIAYDESPVPSAELRSPRSPGSDRTWLALGLGYQMAKNLTLDIGYAHLFAKDAEINRKGATGDLLKGSYESEVDILSGQVVWSF